MLAFALNVFSESFITYRKNSLCPAMNSRISASRTIAIAQACPTFCDTWAIWWILMKNVAVPFAPMLPTT